MKIRDLVKLRLAQTGWTLPTVAKRAGVSRSALYRWLPSGQKAPRGQIGSEDLEKVLGVLDIRVGFSSEAEAEVHRWQARQEQMSLDAAERAREAQRKAHQQAELKKRIDVYRRTAEGKEKHRVCATRVIAEWIRMPKAQKRAVRRNWTLSQETVIRHMTEEHFARAVARMPKL